ncbi:hypothetical protein EN766_30230, partial [Mesorhizobium sp. M2A.F.Ca.ET.046.02.1.1]
MRGGQNVGRGVRLEWRDHLRVHGNLRSRRRGRPARSTAGTEGATPLQSAVDVRAWATVVSAPANRPY